MRDSICCSQWFWNINAKEQWLLGKPQNRKFLGSHDVTLAAPQNRSPVIAKMGNKWEWCKRTGCWKYPQKAKGRDFVCPRSTHRRWRRPAYHLAGITLPLCSIAVLLATPLPPCCIAVSQQPISILLPAAILLPPCCQPAVCTPGARGLHSWYPKMAKHRCFNLLSSHSRS